MGLIDALVRRVQGEVAPLAAPKRLGFEPVFGEVVEEVVAPIVTSSVLPWTAPPPAARAPTFELPAAPSASPATPIVPSPSSQPSPPVTLLRDVVVERNAPPASSPPPIVPAERMELHVERERATVERIERQTVSVRELVERTETIVLPAARAEPRPPPVSAEPGAQPEADVPVVPPSPGTPEVAVPLAPRASPATSPVVLPARPLAQPSPPTRPELPAPVHVHVGTVIVRWPQAPAATPPRPVPAPTTMTLAEYLSARDRRSR